MINDYKLDQSKPCSIVTCTLLIKIIIRAASSKISRVRMIFHSVTFCSTLCCTFCTCFTSRVAVSKNIYSKCIINGKEDIIDFLNGATFLALLMLMDTVSCVKWIPAVLLGQISEQLGSIDTMGWKDVAMNFSPVLKLNYQNIRKRTENIDEEVEGKDFRAAKFFVLHKYC